LQEKANEKSPANGQQQRTEVHMATDADRVQQPPDFRIKLTTHALNDVQLTKPDPEIKNSDPDMTQFVS
jgi:hypothetical protein